MIGAEKSDGPAAPITAPATAMAHWPQTQRRYRTGPPELRWEEADGVSARSNPHAGQDRLVVTHPGCCNGSVQFNPYGGVGAQLAAMIVNAGPAATVETFTEIVAAVDYRPRSRVGPADARELVQWAGRLRAVFGEPTLDGRVHLVNDLLAVVAAPPYVSQHDGRAPHLHYADAGAPLVDRIKAYTAGGLAHALCEDARRIGRCRREGCDIVYVDTSRNGRRRFCSTQCANRTHVADHRRRASRTPAAHVP